MPLTPTVCRGCRRLTTGNLVDLVYAAVQRDELPSEWNAWIMPTASPPPADSWFGRLRRRPPVSRPTSAELEALPAKERQELWDAHRQRPFQVVTGLITSFAVLLTLAFTASGLIYTARALRSTQEGQITDRYTKAVEQLASSTVDVRLGAIYALQRIAADSPRDRLTIRNVLAAFVRHHDFCGSTAPAPQCGASMRDLVNVRLAKRLPTDVAAALAIAASLTQDVVGPVDLSEALFPRLSASAANLSRVDLSAADLTFAWLFDADLSYSNLSQACLTNADLGGADLTKADLRGADLDGVGLKGANLSGADLRGTDLSEVSGMTPDEIRRVAVTDERTNFAKSDDGPVYCGPVSSAGLVIHKR
ncbi:pentapeptide repeat-containing protein [Kribbella sp. NPDC004138]